MTDSRTTRTAPLTAGEIAALRRDGIVVPRRAMFRPGESTATYLVDFSRRPIWLVRGADRTGKNDFRIGH